MLTTNEINALKTQLTEKKNEEGLALLLTLEQMIKESYDYKQSVLRKLTTIETDMGRLIDENERLIEARESAYVERDSCIGLMMSLAIKNGMTAGVFKQNTVALDLPSGQVSWDFEESEAHLFEGLPEYTKAIEEIDITEKYTRVMNPGL